MGNVHLALRLCQVAAADDLADCRALSAMAQIELARAIDPESADDGPERRAYELHRYWRAEARSRGQLPARARERIG